MWRQRSERRIVLSTFSSEIGTRNDNIRTNSSIEGNHKQITIMEACIWKLMHQREEILARQKSLTRIGMKNSV